MYFQEFLYSRFANPNRTELENALADLERATYGLAFASGMAATTAIFHLLKANDHVICGHDCYGGTHTFFEDIAANMSIHVSFIDATNASAIAAAIRPKTAMIWLESPSNPLLNIVDIQRIARLVRNFETHGHRDITLVIDNTFATSYFQKPLELGASISYQSLSKYINGHGDVMAGGLVTNDAYLASRLKHLQKTLGGTPSPFDCYLVKRGLETFGLRMRAHYTNALAIARFLEQHPKIRKVLHPGLDTHPGHVIARRQCYAFSGVVSCYLNISDSTVENSDYETVSDVVVKFSQTLKLFKLAVSLGNTRSLIEIPSLMTHKDVDAKHLQTLGIDHTLVRLSIGIEPITDLIADLKQALTVL